MAASWDLTAASREDHKARANELKRGGVPGDFFIRGRPKSGPANSLGMTVRISSGTSNVLSNFLIERKPAGFQIRGSELSFPSLADLVGYHALAPKPPINIKLNTDDFHDDGLGFGLDELEDEDENYGFSGGDIEGGMSFPQANSAGLKPPSHIPAPEVDMASLSKIEMLRKQAEVLAAKRKAAEMNVQMLSAHNSTKASSIDLREEEERATRERMEAEMLEMRNAGALAAWQKQLEEIDALRSRTRATAERQIGSDSEGLPPRTNVDRSVHRLYEEVGLYSNSFAAKVKQVEEAESQLKHEEERVATKTAVIELIDLTLSKCIEAAVFEVELAQQVQERAKIEAAYEETVQLAEDRDNRLNEVASVMAGEVSQVLARVQSAIGSDQYTGTKENQFSHNARSRGSASSVQQERRTSFLDASRTSGPYGFADSTTISSPRNTGPTSPGQTKENPLKTLTARANAWKPRGSSVNEDIHETPARDSWKQNSSGSGRRSSVAPTPQPTGFSIVKFKKPNIRDADGFGGTLDEECTYLGNCTCPKCR